MAEKADRFLEADDTAHDGKLAPPGEFIGFGDALGAREFGHRVRSLRIEMFRVRHVTGFTAGIPF
jgi:hypothetical protein